MTSRRFTPCRGAASGLLAILVVLGGATAARGADTVHPLRASTPPIIDGRLDEVLWQNAPSASNFKTWLPDYGADLSERTIVYYAYDAENLYFAIRAFDREPSRIKASMASRDNTRQDDWICINLDSFNDQQALYSFYVNPLGIQSDSRFAANKEDLGFDAVWYSAGRIDEQGYTVEVRIPFKSIRYTRKNPVTMGVIVERMISRKSEDGTVPGLDPRMGMNFVIQTQPIEFADIRHYTLLEVLPAATYSRQHAAQAGQLRQTSSGADVGVTAKFGITAELTVDGTYNPDFSQVEADAGQIDVNLRAPLYFPEKRPFFLEGQDVFNLGGPAQTGPLQAVVHTRTIGDPLTGVKLSGKVSRRDTLSVLYAADELAATGGSPRRPGAEPDYAHVTVLRYKHALNQDAYLGGFVTDREQGSAFNRVAGGDGTIRLSDSAALGFYALGSATGVDNEPSAAAGRAVGVEYFRDTRNLALTFGGNDISREFATETGYLTRNGVTSVRAIVGPKFYPSRGIVRRIETSLTTEQTRDAFSGIWETFNQASATVRFRGAISWQSAYHLSSEVFSGKKFGTSGFSTTVSAQVTKRVRLSGSVAGRDAIYYSTEPFGGHTVQAVAAVVYQPSEQWYQQVSVTYANFDRASGGERLYDYAIARSKTSFQLNRFLFFRAILEYNSFRRQLLTDFLASFTYIPGTVLFAGYGSLYERTRWDGLENVRVQSLREVRRGLFLKASYNWRL
ncbi:MAG TPA: DUF5916 domain-containing protein [Vicinamibacterales bacterium]|jgi:hypothetical protein